MLREKFPASQQDPRWKFVPHSKGVGWRLFRTFGENSDNIGEIALAIARRLGRPMLGRSGDLIEHIVPRDEQSAEARSLSELYGLSELPMHIDTAHRLRPARFLLIGCSNPGLSGTKTRLVGVEQLKFTRRELALLASTPVLIRTGRRSFYSTIVDEARPFFRYDPGCMEAVDCRGAEAMQIVENAIFQAPICAHDWQRGDLLLIENWKALHGRTAALADERLLVRVSVQ